MTTIATTMYADRNSERIQVLIGSGNRRMLTAGSTTSSAQLPTGTSGMVLVRASGLCFLNFGTSGVEAAADATSIMVYPGEAPYAVPAGATHFAGIRADSESEDVTVQLESLA